MANQEQLKRLRRGIVEWNEWRQRHSEVRPDLSRADLIDANLSRANLSGADLSRANLYNASLHYANLSNASLGDANLTRASLGGANLSDAILYHANLSGANLYETNFRGADLTDANLSGANLYGTIFTHVDFHHTIFAWVNLSEVKELETADHEGPSNVDINSVTLPFKENTRRHFLRGVGFTETQIEYLPSLLTSRPLQYHSLFISYAHQDQAIAERLRTDFRKNNIPCWFAPHELIPGDYYRYKIEEAIHAYDKLVLILSEHSIKSQWVEKEVEIALKREESMNIDQQVLFPIRLDDIVMTTSRRWISSLRYLRHIGDFTGWQDEAAYQQAFATLLQHLKVNKSPMK